MSELISETVERMRAFAAENLRVGVKAYPIEDYQARVGELLLIHFFTYHKGVLTLARPGKPPSRSEVEKYRGLFEVPEWARVERPSHPVYEVVRLSWQRKRRAAVDIESLRGTMAG